MRRTLNSISKCICECGELAFSYDVNKIYFRVEEYSIYINLNSTIKTLHSNLRLWTQSILFNTKFVILHCEQMSRYLRYNWSWIGLKKRIQKLNIQFNLFHGGKLPFLFLSWNARSQIVLLDCATKWSFIVFATWSAFLGATYLY